MSVFDLDERGQKVALTAGEGVRADQIAPGFLDGLGYGAGMGVMRGAANLARNVSLLGGGTVATVLDQIDNGGQTSYRDRYFKWHDETFQAAADFWTPTASDVGTMGRILGGLGEVVAPLALGPVGAPAMVGSMTATPAIDLARQGVRAEDAIPVGLAQGAAAAVGFRIPFVGNTLTQRMAAGAAGNLATNVPAHIASQGVLRSGGYEAAIIDQYDPWDAEGRMVDVLAGGVFGAVAHAAMVSAKNAKHYQSDSAPRVPVDQAEAAIHSRGMDATLDQLIAGEPVHVPGDVARQFADTPVRANADMAAALHEVAPDLAARSEGVTQDGFIYRGQPEGFDDLQTVSKTDGIDNILIGKGIFTTSSEELASTYGKNIFKFHRPTNRTINISNAAEAELRKFMPAEFFEKSRFGGSELSSGFETYRWLVERGDIVKAEDFLIESMAEKYLPDDVTWTEVRRGDAIGRGLFPDVVREKMSADLQSSGFDFVRHQGGLRAGSGEKLHDVFIALNDTALRRVAFDDAANKVAPDLAARTDDASIQDAPIPDVPAAPEIPMVKTAPDAGQPAAIPELARARAILDASPDLVIRMDDGTDVRAADLIASLEAEHAQTANDANAFAAAVECMLRTSA